MNSYGYGAGPPIGYRIPAPVMQYEYPRPLVTGFAQDPTRPSHVPVGGPPPTGVGAPGQPLQGRPPGPPPIINTAPPIIHPAPPPPPPDEEASRLMQLQSQAKVWQEHKRITEEQERVRKQKEEQQIQQLAQAHPEIAVCLLEEAQFEQQYNTWKKQFSDWKEQNKDHPDKEQYQQYEEQWKQYEVQMDAQKDELAKRRQDLVAKYSAQTSSAVAAPQMPGLTPPTWEPPPIPGESHAQLASQSWQQNGDGGYSGYQQWENRAYAVPEQAVPQQPIGYQQPSQYGGAQPVAPTNQPVGQGFPGGQTQYPENMSQPVFRGNQGPTPPYSGAQSHGHMGIESQNFLGNQQPAMTLAQGRPGFTGNETQAPTGIQLRPGFPGNQPRPGFTGQPGPQSFQPRMGLQEQGQGNQTRQGYPSSMQPQFQGHQPGPMNSQPRHGFPGNQQDMSGNQPRHGFPVNQQDMSGNQPRHGFPGNQQDMSGNQPRHGFPGNQQDMSGNQPRHGFSGKQQDISGNQPRHGFPGNQQDNSGNQPRHGFPGNQQEMSGNHPRHGFPGNQQDISGNQPRHGFPGNQQDVSGNQPRPAFQGHRPQAPQEYQPRPSFQVNQMGPAGSPVRPLMQEQAPQGFPRHQHQAPPGNQPPDFRGNQTGMGGPPRQRFPSGQPRQGFPGNQLHAENLEDLPPHRKEYDQEYTHSHMDNDISNMREGQDNNPMNHGQQRPLPASSDGQFAPRFRGPAGAVPRQPYPAAQGSFESQRTEPQRGQGYQPRPGVQGQLGPGPQDQLRGVRPGPDQPGGSLRPRYPGGQQQERFSVRQQQYDFEPPYQPEAVQPRARFPQPGQLAPQARPFHPQQQRAPGPQYGGVRPQAHPGVRPQAAAAMRPQAPPTNQFPLANQARDAVPYQPKVPAIPKQQEQPYQPKVPAVGRVGRPQNEEPKVEYSGSADMYNEQKRLIAELMGGAADSEQPAAKLQKVVIPEHKPKKPDLENATLSVMRKGTLSMVLSSIQSSSEETAAAPKADSKTSADSSATGDARTTPSTSTSSSVVNMAAPGSAETTGVADQQAVKPVTSAENLPNSSADPPNKSNAGSVAKGFSSQEHEMIKRAAQDIKAEREERAVQSGGQDPATNKHSSLVPYDDKEGADVDDTSRSSTGADNQQRDRGDSLEPRGFGPQGRRPPPDDYEDRRPRRGRPPSPGFYRGGARGPPPRDPYMDPQYGRGPPRDYIDPYGRRPYWEDYDYYSRDPLYDREYYARMHGRIPPPPIPGRFDPYERYEAYRPEVAYRRDPFGADPLRGPYDPLYSRDAMFEAPRDPVLQPLVDPSALTSATVVDYGHHGKEDELNRLPSSYREDARQASHSIHEDSHLPSGYKDYSHEAYHERDKTPFSHSTVSIRHSPPPLPSSSMRQTTIVQEDLFDAYSAFSVPKVTDIRDILYKPKREHRPPHICVIVRGPPGAGKTYVSKLIRDKEATHGGSAPRILNLDDYFMVEVERLVTDEDTGKKVKHKMLEYEYEAEMEESYRQDFLKSFKKTIEKGYFSFIVVDAINNKVRHFEEFAQFARSHGFQVYIVDVMADPQTCFKRNIHHRTLKDIEQITSSWEETPSYFNKLDIRSLLQDDAIDDVDMEDQQSSSSTSDSDSESDDMATKKSKWEMEPNEQKLDKLDGLLHKKPVESHRDMAEFLQLPEDYESKVSCNDGKKHVRWADIEGKKLQTREREMGFVIGQTNWDRVIDDDYAEKQMNKTKYI